MIDSKKLLTDLQKQVKRLEDDLRARCEAVPEVDRPLRIAYEAAKSQKRTALTYAAWRDEELTQVAVAWVLACVFVRFLEDNELIEVPLLAGPGARLQRARDEHEMFFRQNPTKTEREYLEKVFADIGTLPAMKEFFDRKHNPLWEVTPSGDAAKELLDFFRRTNPESGLLTHDFTDPDWNTRFLGDLYQDLSEFARKRYALLQTPVFVEKFILDRTLSPAIQTFGYQIVRMIDPTCGSGHFLLGGFDRLFRLWQQNHPGENPRVLVQKALDQVNGVDLNPNVVAIARFRLLLAALRACGESKMKNAPDFRINLAAGDSLLHGSRFSMGGVIDGVQQTFGGDDLFRDELKHFYEAEDREELHRILGQQYHVVVGNPPYITVKDKALNEAYRNRFDSCHRKYSLGAPFMERFFDLALKGDGKGHETAGYVGMITASSFMKREFGKKLVEDFIPKWDLTHVIDTDKAHIPGHATGTVILFGKNQPPVASVVRTVMGIKKQEPAPEIPSEGFVWLAILAQVDEPGSQCEWLSVADTPRSSFHKHPWSIGGGGAAELKEMLDENTQHRLSGMTEVIGVFGMTNADEVLLAQSSAMRRRCVDSQAFRPAVTGEQVRDWTIEVGEAAIFPYGADALLPLSQIPGVHRWLWPTRTTMGNRATFGGGTYFSDGLPWWKWHQVALERLQIPLSIIYSSVATHNSFVLDRGGVVFKQSAPLIKLRADAVESQYFRLLGLLNSSVACFWMKQVFYDKGGGGIGGGISAEMWEHRFDHDSSKLASFPVAEEEQLPLTQELNRFVQELKLHTPAVALITSVTHTRAALDTAKQRWTETLQRMIALQEELDWECYQLYSLTETKLVLPPDQVPRLQLGERAFEIVMARKLATGEFQTTWFERHDSKPITELPAHWPQPYRELVQRRIALMVSDRNIALIEQPEYKRRWNIEPWDNQLECALREWLLNRLEGYFFGGERMIENHPPSENEDSIVRLRVSFVAGHQPSLVSTNQLASVVETDADFLRIAEIYSGGSGFSVSKLVRELVEAEAVPFLPFQRYKETGLRKRQDWEHVWDLQRQEDAIDAQEKVNEPGIVDVERLLRQKKADAKKKALLGDLPVPPKYASADFKKSNWWKLRGKLDVPKERWIVYTGAERDGDPSPLIAWAGWNHLQQAQALAEYFIDAKQNQGWPTEKLKLLLAGLQDLLPWLKQWHNDLDPELGMGLGDYFLGFLDEQCRSLQMTIQELEITRFEPRDEPVKRVKKTGSFHRDSEVPDEPSFQTHWMDREYSLLAPNRRLLSPIFYSFEILFVCFTL